MSTNPRCIVEEHAAVRVTTLSTREVRNFHLTGRASHLTKASLGIRLRLAPAVLLHNYSTCREKVASI